MNLKKFTLALILVLFIVPTGVVLGGTVFLKNGHVVTGKIIANDEEKVVLTWSNGRATIYQRFVDEVILDSSEEEYLARRIQAQVIWTSENANEDIELPDLSELLDLGISEQQDLASGVDTNSGAEVETGSDSESSSSQVTVLDPEDEAALPHFSRVELEGLGLSIDVPEGWTSVNAENAARVISEDGSVLISLDRYPGRGIAPEEAAVILGERLDNAGFSSRPAGRASLLSVLHPAFVSESLSPSRTQDCIHGLISDESGMMLVSVYTSIARDSQVDGLIASILTSLESPLALR